MNITKSAFVDLRKNTNKIIDTFKKWDRGSRTIAFKILEDGNQVFLDGQVHKAVISMKKPDGQCIYNDCEIVDGAAVVTFSEQMLAASGMATAELNIYDIPSKTLASTSIIKFLIHDKAVDDIRIQSSHEYNALTNMIFAHTESIKECQETIEAANEKISKMTQLNHSVTTAETIRTENETGRNESERNRALAESQRNNEETIRLAAEENRENAESSRAAKESERETAESERREQESGRTAAENTRSLSETQRESNELNRQQEEQSRIHNESSRTQAETGRVKAEATRDSSESSRVLAENGRIQAETKRESMAVSMGTATEAANEAADRANAAADRADGVAEGGLSSMIVNFEESESRETIQSGSTIGNLFGKIKKWFSDLGSAAFMETENIVLQAYPVGSIYMSINNTNPGTLFGGTWTAWGQGRVPIGVSGTEEDFSAPNKTGGSRKITIINKNLPAQVFTLYNAPSGSNGNYAEVKVNSAMSGYVATQISTRAGTADQPIDITPRYTTCYMWQRTA